VYSDNGDTPTWVVEGKSGSEYHRGFQSLLPSDAISLTNGAVITPTATYQPIKSAGSVTVTISITDDNESAFYPGTMLRLVNTSATSILIADSGNVKLASNWTGGQYDSLALMFDGTYWLEIARSDN
jgi:hypothetical protein